MSDQTATHDAIVIERMFDAPANLIWKMWTDGEHFKHWYGPEGMTIPVAEMDARVGGKRLVCMEMGESMRMWFTGEYTEVEPTHRLVYTDSFADENGNPVLPSAYGMNDDEHPKTTIVTVILEEVDGKTKMTMTHEGVDPDSGGSDGWKQSFNKLAEYLTMQ